MAKDLNPASLSEDGQVDISPPTFSEGSLANDTSLPNQDNLDDQVSNVPDTNIEEDASTDSEKQEGDEGSEGSSDENQVNTENNEDAIESEKDYQNVEKKELDFSMPDPNLNGGVAIPDWLSKAQD